MQNNSLAFEQNPAAFTHQSFLAASVRVFVLLLRHASRRSSASNRRLNNKRTVPAQCRLTESLMMSLLMVAAACLELGSAVQLQPFPSPGVLQLQAPALCSNENLDMVIQLKKMLQESKEIQYDRNATIAEVKDLTIRMAFLKDKLDASVRASLAARRITTHRNPWPWIWLLVGCLLLLVLVILTAHLRLRSLQAQSQLDHEDTLSRMLVNYRRSTRNHSLTMKMRCHA